MGISSRHIGIGEVLIAGIGWGFMGAFVRTLHANGLQPLTIAALRSGFSAIVLLTALALCRPQLLKVRLKDLWCMAGSGLVSLLMFNLCYFTTLQHTSIGIAVILLYTSPIFVTLMSHFCFGEAFRRRTFIALALVTAGCVLVSGVIQQEDSIRLPFPVFLLGLGSGFFYALYSIFGRCAQQRGYSSATISLWTFLFAAMGTLPLADYAAIRPLLGSASGFWLPLAGLVPISTILPYVAYTAGLKRLTPSTAAIIATSEPVTATLVGILLFHETLTWSSLTGMILILAAMFL